MTLNTNQNTAIAKTMYAIAILIEGDTSGHRLIHYQAVVGWDEEVVRDRCRVIDANGCLGVVAVFDPADIAAGPAHIGFSFAVGDVVCLQLGSLWMANDHGCAMLVPTDDVRKGHYIVEGDKFMWRQGWPVANLARGRARAARRLREIAEEGGHLPASLSAVK